MLLGLMVTASLPATLVAQESPAVSPFEDALREPADDPPVFHDAEGVTHEELVERLLRTEAELAELRAMQHQAPAADPVPEPGMLAALRDRWSQVRDPSIITVDQQTHSSATKAESPKKWYERLSLRGYTQVRYNGLLWEADGSAPPHHVGDSGIGHNQSFTIRRARITISGDVSDHLYVYMQTEFAGSVPGSPDANHFAQIRDWYGDLYVDDKKVYRVRIGQSKVPFGWENLQSSSNRLPLDRSDTLNSAVRNERDLGLFFYWTPEEAQDLFKYVLDEGLKGSGNYGVLGFGAYNGQGGAFAEQNDNVHIVARIAYPFELDDGQIVEIGLQGYTGKYTVLSAPILPLGVGPAARPAGTLETGNAAGIRDERLAATFVWYPQPLGFQVEWNVGRGPGLNDLQTAVVERSLSGGYAMVMYRHETEEWGTLFPFARYNHYRGGHKSERNAPYSEIDEWEWGLEWQFNPQMELVTGYTITDRTNTRALSAGESYRQYNGHLLRAQFQLNY